MGNLKKVFAVLVIPVLLSTVVFAADGVMSGEKDIRVIKTQWFDIIYPPESARTAAVLSENADKIYTEVTDFFDTEPWFRMPVVITPAQDEFNGYFTISPYNHIVLYDTAPEESMAVFTETVLSTFRHELSHAVTYNMKNKFWRGTDGILGDCYNPAVLVVTTAFAEGAAVTSESAQGEGRLNDEYSKQMVRQAKIEGLFPNWADIQGAKDTYPDGYESYYFGAAFAQWLQDTYGMEKYAKYWYRAVNFQSLTYYTSFKTVYGMKIEQAWAQFKDSVKVPDIPANPLQNDGYNDLFTRLGESAEPEMFTKYNGQGSLYTSLTAGKNCLAWLDDYSSGVWYSALSGNEYDKPVKLFTLDNMTRISLSSDGKYLAVSYLTENTANVKAKVRIYDIAKKRWFTVAETGLRDATVLVNNGEYYLAAVKTHSQYSDIQLYKLNLKNDRIKGTTELNTISSPYGDIPFSLTDAGEGKFASIYKTGMDWSIRLYTIGSGTVTEYKAPADRTVLRNLSCVTADSGETELLFSYTIPGTMPRFGSLKIKGNTAEYALQQEDVSGGIYFPVSFESGIAYIGEFYRDFRLLTADIGKMPLKTVAAETNISSAGTTSDDIAIETDHIQQLLFSSKKYNPLDYYKKGIIIPCAAMTSMVLESGEVDSSSLPWGITYVSSNPWTSGIFYLSAGYDPLGNSGIGMAALEGGTATSLFSYALEGQVEFDSDGYKQTYDIAQVTSSIPVGKTTTFSLSNTATFFEGRQNLTDISSSDLQKIQSLSDYIGLYKNPDMTAHIYGGNSLAAELSNLHSSGPGVYEAAGGSITGSYDVNYSSETGAAFDSSAIYQNLSAELYGQIPRLVPVICKYGRTYNFPTGLSFDLFPSSDYFISGNAETVLYSAEIQKGLPFFAALYFNRVSIEAGYTGKFSYGTADSWDFLKTPQLMQDLFAGSMEYYDTLNLKAILSATPNIGSVASSSCQFDLSASLLYRIHPEDGYSPWGFSLFGTVVF